MRMIPSIRLENRQQQQHSELRISIAKVSVKDGVAEVLAMETMSVMPIEDRVAMSLVVVARDGINGLRVDNGIIKISD